MKKVLSIVLSLVMVLCMMPVMAFAGSASGQYPDVSGEACENAVTTLSNLGVINGYEDGTYKPENVVTRAEAAKLVISALGLSDQAKGSTASFTDLANAKWAEGYIGYAESLGILEGDGDGKFRPADPVTYNEFAAIMVRALGYTDESLQGSYPAAHMAKANALGIMDDITGAGGANGANRGDCAIMLYNNLTNAIGTTDKDGKWTSNANNGEPDDTMMDRLGATPLSTDKNGVAQADVVTLDNARDAIIDLYPYIGAQAVLYQNDDEEVIAIADVESTFLTGEFNSTKTTFEVDGVKYNVTAGDNFVLTTNYDETNASATVGNVNANTEYTIAAKVSGKTLKDIYSVNLWDGKTKQMTSSDITNLSKNDKLNGFEFITDDNDEIDTTSFQLLGVDSLSDIKADDVVTVYNAAGIVKVEVTDETVTGVVSKVSGSGNAAKYTIDDVTYELGQAASAAGTAKAGDEVTLTLTYAGDIWEIDSATTADNYAIVMNAQKENSGSAGEMSGKDAKVQLYTTDGAVIYVVDTKKVDDLGFSTDTEDTKEVKDLIGDLVKYTVKDDKVVALETVTGKMNTATTISKAGYLDSNKISDNAVVFTYSGTNTIGATGITGITEDSVVDKDDLGLSSKSAILGATVGKNTVAYVTDNDEIVAMIIPDGVSNTDTVYGIVVDSYESATYEGTAVDLLIGGELKTDIELGDDTTIANVKDCVVEIKTNVDGSVDLTKVENTGDLVAGSPIAPSVDQYTYLDGNKVKLHESAEVESLKGILADDVIVYVANDDNEYELGDTTDLEVKDGKTVVLYTCNDTDADNYGLVTYAVVK